MISTDLGAKLAADSPLAAAVFAAMPLRIMEVSRWTEEERQDYCRSYSRHLAESADALLYSSGPPGTARDLFPILVTALACMAYMPGGVVFCGHRYEVALRGES